MSFRSHPADQAERESCGLTYSSTVLHPFNIPSVHEQYAEQTAYPDFQTLMSLWCLQTDVRDSGPVVCAGAPQAWCFVARDKRHFQAVEANLAAKGNER
eukprot:5940318-Pleurochrysis_carterae.AAC.1